MRSFEIYGKWSVQTNKHSVRNAVTLVLGFLRLAPITCAIHYRMGGKMSTLTMKVTKVGISESNENYSLN